MGNLRDTISFRLANHLRLSTLRVRPERAIVSFTFDDAPASSVEAGAAALEMRGVRGTYYICGTDLDGHGDLGLPNLSSEQARELARRGHEVACHTDSHKDVRRASRRELVHQLDANAEKLRQVSGTAPNNFAYPYGHIGIGAKLLLENRFDTCRGIYPGLNVGAVDRGHLKAVPLYSHEMDATKAAAWIDAAVRQFAWLIFLTHDVSETPTPCGVTPDLLNFCVEHALAAGCACLNVNGALQSMRAAAAPRVRAPAASASISRI